MLNLPMIRNLVSGGAKFIPRSGYRSFILDHSAIVLSQDIV